jgi:hypothetical protein
MIIATAYRPCSSQGPSTAWMQQWVLLRQAGLKNLNLIQEFYNDLDTQLQEWRQSGYEILLMMDANENIGSKPGGLTSIMGKAGLVDLI